MGKTANHLKRTLRREKRRSEERLKKKIAELRKNIEKKKNHFSVPNGTAKIEGNKNPCTIPAHYPKPDYKQYTQAKGIVPCSFDLEWSSK